jgi:hypothetical protein
MIRLGERVGEKEWGTGKDRQDRAKNRCSKRDPVDLARSLSIFLTGKLAHPIFAILPCQGIAIPSS